MKLICDTRLELWCEALESGRFQRTVGRMCKKIYERGNCFCVLGVALEVYWELHPNEIEFDIKYDEDGSWPYRQYFMEDATGRRTWEGSCWLPPAVAKWYGIREQGQLTRTFKFKGSPYMSCLDTLNDRGWSFKAIAGVIRRGYLERHYI